MTKREFAKALRDISTRGMVDRGKAASLPDEAKHALACHIVRNRGPVLVELVLPGDETWLACCGYLHTTTGKRSGYTFRHTAEHRIV